MAQMVTARPVAKVTLLHGPRVYNTRADPVAMVSIRA